MNTETVEARARRLVDQEVLVCMSSLVSTIASAYGDGGTPAILELSELASELCSPIPDYESAAVEAGWSQTSFAPAQVVFTDATDSQTWCAADWQSLCNDHDIEPHDREVFEHWAISDYLGRKLEAYGEKVEFDFQGLVIWARTTTGQTIYADHVIELIAKELLA